MLYILEKITFCSWKLITGSLHLQPVYGQSLLGKRQHTSAQSSDIVRYGCNLVGNLAGCLRNLKKHRGGPLYRRAHIRSSARDIRHLIVHSLQALGHMGQILSQIRNTLGQLVILIARRRSACNRRDRIIHF